MYRLCLQGQKGLESLKGFHSIFKSEHIVVVIGKDKKVDNDFSQEISAYCQKNNICTINDSEDIETILFTLAVGWQRIINDVPMDRIVVMHDSILPRYRGFNPLVSALINGDKQIGVTAILAEEAYDTGPIIAQEVMDVNYPIKIASAIEKISAAYKELAVKVATIVSMGGFQVTAQQESRATYSLWRDEEDYFIDFNWTAEKIKRHVDSVGYPYMGARSYLNGKKIYIDDVEVVEDFFVENRSPGKVIFLQDSIATVVCGQGLIKITAIRDNEGEPIKVNRFRSRFK